MDYSNGKIETTHDKHYAELTRAFEALFGKMRRADLVVYSGSLGENHPEGDRANLVFGGKHWREVSAKIIDEDYDLISIMKRSEFAVLLPAWIRAITAYPLSNAELEYHLSPRYDAPEAAEFRDSVYAEYDGTALQEIVRLILEVLARGKDHGATDDQNRITTDAAFWTQS
jgi:hypothetical protein